MTKKASKKGASKDHTPTSAKKAIVLGEAQTHRKPSYLLLGITLLALAVVGLVVWGAGRSGSPVSTGMTPTATAAEVRLPLAQFDDGQARHFEHKSGDLTVRYFVLKSADGVVRAAFDACDVCWPAGRGYVQEGDVMICRNCGRRFASIRINEVKGGCNPAPLRRAIDGDQLVIQVADIEAGSSYFDFQQKG
jgi:uncharacterized membrane protein